MSISKTNRERACEAASAVFDRTVSSKFDREATKIETAVRVRFWVMAWLRKCSDLSYPQIAIALHMACHTSVMHGERRAYEIWGEEMFDRLSLEQRAMRRAEQKLYDLRGKRRHCFVNGCGWEAAA